MSAETPHPKLESGTVLDDRFEILGILGEGGTGIVYDAKRVSDQMPIALKVIHRELAGDRQIRGRFMREAVVLRMLEGRNVCPVLESGELAHGDSGAPLLFLALPKIEGRSLASRLARGGPVSMDEAVRLVGEILSALGAAHSKGIIHRDLKPQNVLLRGGEEVVVVDFGMSKIVTGAATGVTATGTTGLTAHNMVFGTPEYMSPEQARGDEVDARCDLYACGVILYELVTGTVPFSGGTPLTVSHAAPHRQAGAAERARQRPQDHEGDRSGHPSRNGQKARGSLRDGGDHARGVEPREGCTGRRRERAPEPFHVGRGTGCACAHHARDLATL